MGFVETEMTKTSGEHGQKVGCPEDIDLWILAGQSNMEGVGELADAMPPDCLWPRFAPGVQCGR